VDRTEIARLETMAVRLRRNIVQMIGAGKAGHPGGSCSLAEIVAALYFSRMYYDPRAEIMNLKTLEGMLQGHPDMELTPGAAPGPALVPGMGDHGRRGARRVPGVGGRHGGLRERA
jgi:transketolase N-terminal domain/subunit